MKKIQLPIMALIFTWLVALLPTSGGCSETGKVIPPPKAVPKETKFVIPDAKAAEWENIQLNVQKVYEVCAEHCGTYERCKTRCAKSRDNNLQREYNKMTLQ